MKNKAIIPWADLFARMMAPWKQTEKRITTYLQKKEAGLNVKEKKLLLILYILLVTGCLLCILLRAFGALGGSPIRVLLPINPMGIL
ncbi:MULTISPECIES: hypothetical protein [Cyclobacteriaceae]|uniref:Uncharacterized protein n=2 Tax=Cyclobacteriaceae TaxID=563798 RepID=A0ABV9T0C4_9BACT